VSSSDKIGKLYRNQGNLFAIDDDDDDSRHANGSESGTAGLNDADHEQVAELVNLKTWLEKPDVVNKFKCFYREKREGGSTKTEWVPGYVS
jgi:hypothetical protein